MSTSTPSPDLGDGKRNGKRLIILCDGTWQNAESSPEKRTPPSNIIRLTRAIKPSTWLVEEDESGNQVKRQIDQIVHYQSGVGTGTLDSLVGGTIGVGLSEKIRSAYAFIANNYVDGDKIYIFGFSRGAFTARAIAGLITKMGLLDKRGMDNFPIVYEDYYKMPKDLSPEEERARFRAARAKYGVRRPPMGTIEAIGVFDTVGFHRPVTGSIPWLNSFFGEQYELHNAELPTGVNYAFHALSLDENRFAFKPTLWYQPTKRTVPGAGKHHQTVLKQCWFSGGHQDVGGGMKDPRLSNISLGWMVSELTKYSLLDFDPDYLLEKDNTKPNTREDMPWPTAAGKGGDWWESQLLPIRILLSVVFFFVDLLQGVAQGVGYQRFLGLRTPGMDHKEGFNTNEFIHASVKDRQLLRLRRRSHEAYWPCRSLKGWTPPVKEKEGKGKNLWVKRVRGQVYTMKEAPVSAIELRCKNNIRNASPKYAEEVFKFVKDCHFSPFEVPVKKSKRGGYSISDNEEPNQVQQVESFPLSERLHPVHQN